MLEGLKEIDPLGDDTIAHITGSLQQLRTYQDLVGERRQVQEALERIDLSYLEKLDREIEEVEKRRTAVEEQREQLKRENNKLEYENNAIREEKSPRKSPGGPTASRGSTKNTTPGGSGKPVSRAS